MHLKSQLIKRNSCFELLRILAMFMILTLHADFFSLGTPTVSDLSGNTISAFTRIAIEMIAISGVNVFVLISGWFGINPTFKGVVKFLFQCLFIVIGLYIVGLIIGKANITATEIAQCLFLSNSAGWFVTAYLGLYLLSPILNYFCLNTPKKNFTWTIIIFYIYQTIGGVLTNATPIFNNGYSVTSFIGLYLLGRYLNLYGLKMFIHRGGNLILYALTIILLISWLYFGIIFNQPFFAQMSMNYANPLIVLNALCILGFAVTQQPKYNFLINFLAGSSFTVYLCHNCNSWTIQIYRECCKGIFDTYSGCLYFLIIIGFMVSIYTYAVIINQLRILAWKNLYRFINNWKHKFRDLKI